MHEESLVRTLLQQVEEVARQHAATRVQVVEVEVGPLSGVEVPLLQSAWERLLSQSACGNAELTVRQVPLTAVCSDCGKDLIVSNFRFQCTACGSQAVRITGGDQMRLLQVTLETA